MNTQAIVRILGVLLLVASIIIAMTARAEVSHLRSEVEKLEGRLESMSVTERGLDAAGVGLADLWEYAGELDRRLDLLDQGGLGPSPIQASQIERPASCFAGDVVVWDTLGGLGC